jgi:hypothetical protein
MILISYIYIYQSFYELLTCCHKVDKVVIMLPTGHLQKAQENRYLAAIKAIDPDVIKILEEEFESRMLFD